LINCLYVKLRKQIKNENKKKWDPYYYFWYIILMDYNNSCVAVNCFIALAVKGEIERCRVATVYLGWMSKIKQRIR